MYMRIRKWYFELNYIISSANTLCTISVSYYPVSVVLPLMNIKTVPHAYAKSCTHTHTAAASTNQFNVFVDDLFIAFSYTYIKHGICRMVYSYVWIHSYTYI